MGEVSKPLIIVLLILFMCSYSQALQNLRHSLRGPNPIYHDMENPVRKNTYNPYRQVPDGPDGIHNKMEG